MDQNQQIGKRMSFIACIIAFGLLIWFFNGALERQYNPNSEPESFQIDGQTEVKLKRNKQGHYVSGGFINNQAVVFLLDTGATNVSVPIHLASSLGLVQGSPITVVTANGNATAYQTRIDTLQIGDIHVNDVSANLNPGMRDNEILLGMSVLGQLEFRQSGDWLFLRQQ
jgi:aspartyl protease family protein